MVTAYYKAVPSDPLEVPQKLTVFNKWPSIEIEADLVTHKLNGIYEYPNGKRTDTVIAFCPKTKAGLYIMGYNPDEIVARKLSVLKRVEDI
jgi:hypothetical protein